MYPSGQSRSDQHSPPAPPPPPPLPPPPPPPPLARPPVAKQKTAAMLQAVHSQRSQNFIHDHHVHAGLSGQPFSKQRSWSSQQGRKIEPSSQCSPVHPSEIP